MLLARWNPALHWGDQTVAILGSGPSMSKEVADKLRGKCKVIAINDTFRLAPWADMLYAADFQWWNYHRAEVIGFKGLKATLSPATQVPGVMLLKNVGEVGVSFRNGELKTGKNSGHQAMQIAAQLGASTILLCGFDMQSGRLGNHFFGEHPPGVHKEVPPFAMFVQYMTMSAGEYERRKIKVINCTPKSALKCYTMMSLEQALESFCNDTRNAVLSA